LNIYRKSIKHRIISKYINTGVLTSNDNLKRMCNKWWNLPTFRFPRRWIAPRRVECERCTWFRWWTIVIRVK